MAVAALDISGENAASTAEQIVDQGGRAISVAVDVADASQLAAAAERVNDEFGRCDHLFANVGVQQFGRLDRLTSDDWDWLLSVNVKGTAQTVNAFLPLLRSTDGPRGIALTSSDSALAATARLGGYIVTKAAVMAYGDVLRLELAEEEISVTTIFPAGMMTTHLDSSRAARPELLGPSLLDMDDLTYVATNAAPSAGDLLDAEQAVTGLLAAVVDGTPYFVTHGSSRGRFEPRVHEIIGAYDDMAARRGIAR